MTGEYLQYAESLASDLGSGGQPVSANVVRVLIEERARLLYACQALIDAPHDDHFSARMNEREMDAIEKIKRAIRKATT